MLVGIMLVGRLGVIDSTSEVFATENSKHAVPERLLANAARSSLRDLRRFVPATDPKWHAIEVLAKLDAMMGRRAWM